MRSKRKLRPLSFTIKEKRKTTLSPLPSVTASPTLSVYGSTDWLGYPWAEQDDEPYIHSLVVNPWKQQDGTTHTYVMALEETKKICRDNVGVIGGKRQSPNEIARIIYVASGEYEGSATARVAAIVAAYNTLSSKVGGNTLSELNEGIAEEFFKMILTKPSNLERLRRTGAGLLQAATLVPTTIGILAAAETFANTAFGVSIVMNAPVVVPVLLLAAIVPRVLVAVVNAVRKKQVSESTHQVAADIIRATISGLGSFSPERAAQLSQNIVMAAQRIFVGMDKDEILSAARSGAAFADHPQTSRAIIAACERVSPGMPMRFLNRALGTNLGGGRAATRW